MKSANRWTPLVAVLLGLTAAAFLMAANLGTGPLNGLTVHEWGTFTSVAGVDGNAAPWDTLGCASDLPTFVSDSGLRNAKWRLMGKVRMETPVIYFYSPREVEAHVRVAFPHGLITEWYPKAENRTGHMVPDGSVRPLDPQKSVTPMENTVGGLEWTNVLVQPGAAAQFPRERASSRYYAARETDAAPLTVDGQHEKFLFYRGIADFPAPLTARVSDDGGIDVEVQGSISLGGVFLFENRGGRIGFREEPGKWMTATLQSPVPDAPLSELLERLETALVANGLFPKEAHAMVETWRDSWFEDGSRLIYILPSEAVNEILPLQVEPAPAQIKRVFVGRVELFTPETKLRVEAALARGDWDVLQPYGRFLEPILQRLYPGDLARVSQAEQFYQSLQASHNPSCQ